MASVYGSKQASEFIEKGTLEKGNRHFFGYAVVVAARFTANDEFDLNNM